MIDIIYCEKVKETKKAYLLRSKKGKEVWIPKSQCFGIYRDGKITVNCWILEDKGMGYETECDGTEDMCSHGECKKYDHFTVYKEWRK